MYQKFNNNNIISKFIKDILKDTYIPTVSIWNEGDPIVKGFTYVTKEYIVKGKKDYNPDIETKNISVLNSEYFEIIKPYIEGEFYRGVTSNYESFSSVYDSETHLHLGNYLRMIRDLKGIDLMQYYNCCNGVVSDKLRIKINNQTREIIATNNIKDGFKTIVVPIKYYKKYTIYLNCNYPIIISPIYYDGTNVLTQSSNLDTNFKIINNVNFNRPIVYESFKPSGKEANGLAQNYYLEKYLTLLIQVPQEYSSNIVVLEGDYSDIRFINKTTNEGDLIYINELKKVHFGKSLEDIDEKDAEKYFISIPSLTRNLQNKMFAFSDRLIEYLLNNVIDKNDEISQDILRIQTYISSYKSEKVNGKRYINTYIKGVWDRNIRGFIYDLTTDSKNTNRIDVNGYVDKDIENIILGGK